MPEGGTSHKTGPPTGENRAQNMAEEMTGVRELTYTQALNEALREELEADPRVFLMGEDIGDYGGVFGVTRGLAERFGTGRIRDTPISEAAFVGVALGAAAMGKVPVVEIMFIDFTLVAMDQIVNQVAKARYMSGGQLHAQMVIRTTAGAYRGGGAQHSQSLEALFVHIPGLKVAMPATPYDAKGLLKTAIQDPDPILFIEHRMLYSTRGAVPQTPYTIPLGVASVRREGRDVTIVATSRMVAFALEAAASLQRRGISVEVIDPRTLVPFDWHTITQSLAKTGRVVIVHEATEFGGIGAEIAAHLQRIGFDFLDAPILRVGSRFAPIPYAAPLEAEVLPSVDRIIQAVEEVLGKRKPPS